MKDIFNLILSEKIKWTPTNDEEFTFSSTYEGKIIKLRMNDFPDEPLCTLFINNEERDVDEFPENWSLLKRRIP